MSDRELAVFGARLVHWTRIDGDNGSLIVGEHPEGMPFEVRRVFTLLNIPHGEVRGTHAHRQCEQLLVCLVGSVTAIVDDGLTREEVVLDDPSLGLYMPALTWGTQYQYSADAVLVVFASDPYDADDYIHDYEEFRILAATQRDSGSSAT